MRAMAEGLFASLVISVILSQLAKIPKLGFLDGLTTVTSISSPVIGCAIGVAVAFSLGAKSNVLFASTVTGALGYALGGPLGAFLAAALGAEIGSLIAGKTKLDLLLSPMLAIVSGGLVAVFICPYISRFAAWLGELINSATSLHPALMGLVIAVVVGMLHTSPLSAAAICLSIGLDGVAAGAACVGCCCQMTGFAAASFKDNGFSATLLQSMGTSFLQFSNIVKHPQIWLAPILSSAVLGPVSAILGMTNTSTGAGLGTMALIGQFAAIDTMGFDVRNVCLVLLVHIIAPLVLTLTFDLTFRKLGWVKNGYMRI